MRSNLTPLSFRFIHVRDLLQIIFRLLYLIDHACIWFQCCTKIRCIIVSALSVGESRQQSREPRRDRVLSCRTADRGAHSEAAKGVHGIIETKTCVLCGHGLWFSRICALFNGRGEYRYKRKGLETICTLRSLGCVFWPHLASQLTGDPPVVIHGTSTMTVVSDMVWIVAGHERGTW